MKVRETTMYTYTLKKKPPILSLAEWVAENPQRAKQVGANLIGLGVVILVLAAIFSA